MSALDIYLEEAVNTKGMWHLGAVGALRVYMKETSKDELIKAIKNIDEPRKLRVLMEAGLNAELMKAVTDRYDTLTKGG